MVVRIRNWLSLVKKSIVVVVLKLACQHARHATGLQVRAKGVAEEPDGNRDR